jgi:hypothetical protein
VLELKEPFGDLKSFGLILLILFFFLMALFFDWKVYRVLMVGGLSRQLSKSSFILSILGVFAPKRTNGADRRSDHSSNSSNTKYNNEHSRQLAHRVKS